MCVLTINRKKNYINFSRKKKHDIICLIKGLKYGKREKSIEYKYNYLESVSFSSVQIEKMLINECNTVLVLYFTAETTTIDIFV